MAVPEEGEQVIEKLAEPGGANVVVQVQFTDTAAQINPQVLIVHHPELPAALVEKIVAIFVKGRDAEAGQVGPAQLLLHPLTHLLGRILGVGDSQNFVGPGVSFANQVGDAPGEDRGLPRARTGDDQHRPVDMLDSFALALVRLERPVGLPRR